MITEFRMRIEEAQRRVKRGEVDLRPIGEALFGKWDQDYPAQMLENALRFEMIKEIFDDKHERG